MGLDMYAYKTKEAIAKIGFEYPADLHKIAYWRKHPNLHGWMEKLYVAEGGERVFNCQTVRLDTCDLDLLETAVKKGHLPDTIGFFFGESQPEHKAEDLAFIKKARKALKDGYNVFYTSWW